MNIMTLEEAAEFLRCSPRTLSEMAAKGNVPTAMIGGKYLFVAGQLQTWVEARALEEMTARQIEVAPPVKRSKGGRKREIAVNWSVNPLEATSSLQ